MDGASILPLMKDEKMEERGIGWILGDHYGFRYGKWKLTKGFVSCKKEDCGEEMLFDLEKDLGERHNLAKMKEFEGVLEEIKKNYSDWRGSVENSYFNESGCQTVWKAC